MSKDLIYTLKWKYFTPNIASRVSDMFIENSLCDVTLVSDDQKPFHAHRYVLSTFSPVLKNILLDNPHSHPLIYLRGINHQELDSILQFIYLEKAWVKHSNMKRFAQAARDLQIKKLVEIIRMGNHPEPQDLDNNDNNPNDSSIKSNENENMNENTGKGMDDEININIPGTDELGSGKQLYRCEECKVSYKNSQALHHHTSSKHEGICYSCNYCGFKATLKTNLRRHQEAIHEGVTYSCDQCDYHATQQWKLKTHKQSVHEGVKYSCEHCDYKASDKSNLKNHKKSVHEGVKYFCDRCSYQTAWRQTLRIHKYKKH